MVPPPLSFYAAGWSVINVVSFIHLAAGCCLPSIFGIVMGTSEAALRMDNVELKEEWQDDDFPRLASCPHVCTLTCMLTASCITAAEAASPQRLSRAVNIYALNSFTACLNTFNIV